MHHKEGKIRHIDNQPISFIEGIFEKLPTWLVIFIPLVMMFATTHLSGNEEQYLQLAKQYMNPNWIIHSQNLTEVAGTRILYQLILGSILQFFSFETTVLIFRLVFIIGFTIVLDKIYQTLSLDNFQIFFHITLFTIILDQSFFGGSWMFIGVEPKSFSYLAILFSFYYLLNDKYIPALALLVIATYFHILVGGYSFFYLMATLFLFKKDAPYSLRQLVLAGGIYTIFIIPFVMYLKSTSLNTGIVDSTVSPSWIYTYFRSPHHTAIAKSTSYFIEHHFNGVITAMLALVVSIVLYRLSKRKNVQLIHRFVIVSFLGTLCLIPIAFIDKNGDFLKFYLYRINSLSTFFFALLVPIWIYALAKREYLKFIKPTIIVIGAFVLIRPTLTNVIKTATANSSKASLIEMCEYIKSNTKPESLIFSFPNDHSITRRTQRSLFSVKKFIPAQLDKLPEWYNRVLEKENILNDATYLKNAVKKYNINYILISKEKAKSEMGELIFENKKYALLKPG